MEIVVVVAIALVLATLAVPSFATFIKNLRLQSTENTIKRQLMAAKIRALANPLVHCGVYLDESRTRIFFDQDNSGTYNSGDITYQAPFDFPEGITLEVPTGYFPEIIFRGNGSASLSGKAIVSNSARADTIEVLASTGRIRVKKGT
jgi:Tfp pilus assembly protein FimT